MNIVNLIQGSPEWLAHRMQHNNASDAPAMMGCSKYKTRSDLVREVATGLGEEITPEKQRLFDAGHAYEPLARPLAEEILGEELYPVVGTKGKLSASFDGLTLMNDKAWEHKSLNDDLRRVLPAQGVGGPQVGAALPLMYRVQMEQQAEVSGCEIVLFTASKWNGDTLVDARHCWYLPDPELRAQILAGWDQFEADVCAYQPAEVVPTVVSDAVEALPAVLVKVSGEIAITANFAAFQTKLQDFLDHQLIREPKTDQDFATLDTQIKAMKGAEAALDAAEGQMLAQIASVDAAKRTKDMLHKLVRDNRLMAEKLLASEKDRRKAEIVAAGQAKLREHIAALSKRVGFPLPTVAVDIAGAVKGKKSITSMEDAIETELARGKIEANRVADLIDANRRAMAQAEAEHLFLDFAQVATKPADDFANLITSRRAIAAQRLEQERERIRAEEAARLEREQREAQARADAQARAQREAEEAAARQAEVERQRVEAQRQRETESAAQRERQAQINAQMRTLDAAEDKAIVAAPAPEVVPLRSTVPAANEVPTLALGEIKARIAPLSIDAAGLESLGFPPKKERGACLYRESQWPAMHAALVKKLIAAAPQQQAA